MIDDREILIPNPESVFREEEDGAFLFDPENGNLKFINGMGRTIYRLCDGQRSVMDVKSSVKNDYPEIPAEKIDEDIDKFMRDISELGFLRSEKDTR